MEGDMCGQGFHMIQSVFTPEQLTFEKRARGQYIFNGGHGGGHFGDRKRFQASFFSQEVAAVLTRLVPGRTVNDMVMITSEPRCEEQPAHTDAEIYTLRRLVRDDDGVFGGYPAGCIVAIQDGTMLKVWPYSINFSEEKTYLPVILELNAGDVLFFRLDLIHAGAAYEVRNRRIHCFLDRPGLVREENQTSYMDYHRNVKKF
jgi:hypothetical protein